MIPTGLGKVIQITFNLRLPGVSLAKNDPPGARGKTRFFVGTQDARERLICHVTLKSELPS
jgi:hypothetical protein